MILVSVFCDSNLCSENIPIDLFWVVTGNTGRVLKVEVSEAVDQVALFWKPFQ